MPTYVLPKGIGLDRDVFKKHGQSSVEYTVPCVYHANDIPWVHDLVVYGIDLGWLAHLEDCDEEDHDICGPESYEGVVLIGDWKQDSQGRYVVNRSGSKEFAAIYLDGDVHVIWSTRRGKRGWCSPCAPGQCHARTPGPQRCYVLPKEWEQDDDE